MVFSASSYTCLLILTILTVNPHWLRQARDCRGRFVRTYLYQPACFGLFHETSKTLVLVITDHLLIHLLRFPLIDMDPAWKVFPSRLFLFPVLTGWVVLCQADIFFRWTYYKRSLTARSMIVLPYLNSRSWLLPPPAHFADCCVQNKLCTWILRRCDYFLPWIRFDYFTEIFCPCQSRRGLKFCANDGCFRVGFPKWPASSHAFHFTTDLFRQCDWQDGEGGGENLLFHQCTKGTFLIDGIIDVYSSCIADESVCIWWHSAVCLQLLYGDLQDESEIRRSIEDFRSLDRRIRVEISENMPGIIVSSSVAIF